MSEPSALPSLALWLDGRQPAFSDAGVTAAAAPFGRVAQIAQPAPLSGNWTATGNARPWRDGNALDCRYYGPGHTVGSAITQPASVSIAGNNCTIGIAWEQRGGGGYTTLFAAAVRAVGVYLVGGAPTLANATTLNTIPGISPGIVPGHRIAQCTLVIVCGASQYDIRFTVNGVAYTTTVAVTPSSAALGAFTVGANALGSTQAAISQFVVCATTLNGTDQTALQNFLLANVPAGYPVDAPLVAMAGDSICEAWPAGVQPELDGIANPPRWLNAGVAGAHATLPGEIPSFYTTDILPRYSASRAKNIIVCEGISVNDIAYRLSQGDSVGTAAATVLAGYYAYCDRAKADGWTVIVCTLTPNLGGSNYDAIRAIVNPDIRANWAAHGAFLADIGATAGMATTADAANTAYFADGTHPTVGGYVLLDGTLLPAITAALASVVPVVPSVPALVVQPGDQKVRRLR
jgi:hypothetical protein